MHGLHFTNQRESCKTLTTLPSAITEEIAPKHEAKRRSVVPHQTTRSDRHSNKQITGILIFVYPRLQGAAAKALVFAGRNWRTTKQPSKKN